MGRTVPHWASAAFFFFAFFSHIPLWAQTATNTMGATKVDAKQSAGTSVAGDIKAGDEKQGSPLGVVPKFTSKSQLVLVPVVVTGKDGQHVGWAGA